jgi:hypothetical protein
MSHHKIQLSRVQCSHTAEFINALDLFLKNHNLIQHVLIDTRRSNIVDVQSFRGAVCDGHYLVVAKFRQRLSVSKQAAQILMWRDFITRS